MNCCPSRLVNTLFSRAAAELDWGASGKRAAVGMCPAHKADLFDDPAE
jgi:hypothetical protein